MNAHNVPAVQSNLREVVQEYLAKRDGGKVFREVVGGELEAIAEYPGLDAVVKEYERFHTQVDMASTVGGTYVGRVYNYHPSISKSTLAANLLESAWRHVYRGLNIGEVAPAKDRKQFELSLKNPPEFTLEKIREVFGEYLLNSRFHKLRGLAECFTNLDPAFKSHSKVKIGVEGLPKRIIITSVLNEYTKGYGADQLRDVIDSLNVVQGDPRIGHKEFHELLEEARKEGVVQHKGLKLKTFKNGNGHLIFSKHKLVQVNEALAEFYGDILPDVEQPDAKRRASTAVSKDLQYYPTPKKVLDHIMRDRFYQHRGENAPKLLEPSCGCGRILDAVKAEHPEIQTIGVEVHSGRAQEAMNKGHRVLIGNFLQVVPKAEYDWVFMNPPFYGQHWRKHLEHAIKFLRPAPENKPYLSGAVICILPATAFYDGHLGDMGLVRKDAHLQERGWRDTGWHDLPVASFAESGTNVPTGYFVTDGKKV